MTGPSPAGLPADNPGLRFWLAQGMARALGVRLAGALAEGRLGLYAYRRLLADCTACRSAAPCVDWLARPVPSPERGPAFCAIAPVLATLEPAARAGGPAPANPV